MTARCETYFGSPAQCQAALTSSLAGQVTFHVGEENYDGEDGSLVFLPRAVPHTFSIRTPSARMLLLNAPGGFERMFELAPATPEEAVAALARYEVAVVGPHPRDAAQVSL